MDNAGIREALRRIDEAYRRGLERLNQTQELINLSQLTLRGRRSTRRSSWRTVPPGDEGTDTPAAAYQPQESRHQSDRASPDRHQSAPGDKRGR